MQNRTSTRWTSIAAVAMGASCLLCSHAAGADDKQACLDSYDKAQTYRREGKLIEAHEQLLICVRTVCPAIIKRDCTQWIGEVEEATPSVVLSARGPDGQDAVDVAVTVDGKPFVSQLDGKAVAINPGVHQFHFELEGAEPIDQRIVITEATKSRAISVTFKAAGKTTDEGASHDDAGNSDLQRGSGGDLGTGRHTPAMAYVLGGVGLVGVGGLAYFGLKFDGELNDMDACKPNCPQSDADHASKTRLFALISGGVGVVSLGVATYLFLAPPGAAKANVETSRAPRVDVLPLEGGALGMLRGQF
jgi:hypothetical protein